jgi:hypothetical protein
MSAAFLYAILGSLYQRLRAAHDVEQVIARPADENDLKRSPAK